MATEAPFSAVVKSATDQLSRALYDLGSLVASTIEKSGASSTDLLVSVLSNGINVTLGQIKSVLAGTLKIEALYADGESDVYKGFSGSITGTTALTVWTPNSGKRFLLKGYAIAGIVGPTNPIAAASCVLLYLADGGMSNGVVAPIATIHKDGAINVTAFAAGNTGTSVTGTPVVVNLGSGRKGSAGGSSGPLRITTDIDISTGTIKLVGVVWGREIPYP